MKNTVLPVLLAVLIILSCNDKSLNFSRIEFKIPDYVNIKAEDLKNALGDVKTDPSSGCYLVVVLYSYSSGTETISFSGGDDVKTVNGSGKIKGLVKVMDGKKIIMAEFIESGGNSKEEMISSFVKEVRRKLIK